MNQNITHLTNGDFQVDPVMIKARTEALNTQKPEEERKVIYKNLSPND